MATIKIDGFDVYTYSRVAAGDGLDLSDSDFLEPQFGDSGVSDGDTLISVNTRNKEAVIPVHLRSADGTKDKLHQIVSDINRRCSQAQQLEWRDDNATNSSYYNIRFARFEPEFNKRRQDAGWMSGIIRIFVEPFARTVASGYAFTTGSFAGTGVSASISLASRISGDAPLTMRFEMLSPAAQNAQSHGRIIAGAILPASYVSDWAAASMVLADSSAFRVGASGAAGSQLVMHNSFSGPLTVPSAYVPKNLVQIILTCASAYAGNNRVLAVANSFFQTPIGVRRDDGSMLTSLPTSNHIEGYGTVDLGVINIDPRKGATSVITISTDRVRHSRDTANVVGTAAVIGLNRIILLPEDTSTLLVDDSKRRVLAGVEGDKTSGASSTPITIDDFGNLMIATSPFQSAATQFLIRNSFGQTGLITPASSLNGAYAEFVATANNISGVLYGADSGGTATPIIYGIGKHTNAGDWYVKWTHTNATVGNLAIIYQNASVTGSTVASIAFTPSTTLTELTLRMRQQGPAMSGEVIYYSDSPLFNSFVPAIASVSANIPEAAGYGTPLVQLKSCAMQQVRFTSIPSTGVLGSQTYSVDTDYKTVLRNNFDLGYGMRGGFLTCPPNASKYNAAAVYNLPLDRSDGLNQPWSANVSLNERFTYSK